MPNVQHRMSPRHRNIPLLAADYAFLNDPLTQDVTPFLVVYVLPWRVVFASVIDTKGSNPQVVKRLARWMRECGLTHFVDRSDREHSIRALLFEAAKSVGIKVEDADPGDGDDDVVRAAVPEESRW